MKEEEFIKLQKLAKLSLAPEERENFVRKLDKVVNMIEKLQEVNCESIDPLNSVCTMNQSTVEDVAVSHTHDLFSHLSDKNKNFAKETQCFVVPKMIE